MAFFSFTKKILQNKKISVFNKGKHLRDFTYIDDVIDGIIKILFESPKIKKNSNFDIFNIGLGKPISLLNFIKIIENILCKQAKISLVKKQDGDMEKTYSSIRKIKKFYNYNPNIKPKEGLKKFIDWYLNYYKIR